MGPEPSDPRMTKRTTPFKWQLTNVELTTDSLQEGTELEKGVHLLPLVVADANRMGYCLDIKRSEAGHDND